MGGKTTYTATAAGSGRVTTDVSSTGLTRRTNTFSDGDALRVGADETYTSDADDT